MQRREVLATLAAVSVPFSGCVADGSDTSGTSSGSRPTVTIERVDDIPHTLDIGLRIAVEMLETEITSSHPARLRVTLRNTGNTKLEIGDGNREVFSEVYSDETDPGLLLVPPDHFLLNRVPICWRPIVATPSPGSIVATEVPPGASRPVEYEVWGQPSNSLLNCIPAGEYSFTTTYRDFTAYKQGRSENIPKFEWGFILSVDE